MKGAEPALEALQTLDYRDQKAQQRGFALCVRKGAAKGLISFTTPYTDPPYCCPGGESTGFARHQGGRAGQEQHGGLPVTATPSATAGQGSRLDRGSPPLLSAQTAALIFAAEHKAGIAGKMRVPLLKAFSCVVEGRIWCSRE
jgi:hypothetical protein